jgi:hypothetical protein
VPKEYKPGWEYYTWKEPDLEFALHKETGWVYFLDGTRYSPEEITLLNERNAKITEEIHRLKRFFRGEIVEVTNEPGTGTANERKSVERGGGENNLINSDTDRKISDITGKGADIPCGELEIY